MFSISISWFSISIRGWDIGNGQCPWCDETMMSRTAMDSIIILFANNCYRLTLSLRPMFPSDGFIYFNFNAYLGSRNNPTMHRPVNWHERICLATKLWIGVLVELYLLPCAWATMWEMEDMSYTCTCMMHKANCHYCRWSVWCLKFRYHVLSNCGDGASPRLMEKLWFVSTSPISISNLLCNQQHRNKLKHHQNPYPETIDEILSSAGFVSWQCWFDSISVQQPRHIGLLALDRRPPQGQGQWGQQLSLRLSYHTRAVIAAHKKLHAIYSR